MRPPIEQPITTGRSRPSSCATLITIVVYASVLRRYGSSRCQSAGGELLPCHGMSNATTR